MPRKGQRRTKPRATKDFEQKRRKVGKTKRVPENVTQVSFKSKSVVIPSQYQGGEQGATSHRKQSLHVMFMSNINGLVPFFMHSNRRDNYIHLT